MFASASCSPVRQQAHGTVVDFCLRAYQSGGALIVKPLTGLDEAVATPIPSAGNSGVRGRRAIMSTDPLLQPYRLKHLVFRNRLMSTAHEPAYTVDGMPKER
jgi:hypothetical protein